MQFGMDELSNYPRHSIEVANAKREVVHSRRWLGGFAIANTIFFLPIICALVLKDLQVEVTYAPILNPWQYAVYGAILNVGFLTMPMIRLARNTGCSFRWVFGRVALIALSSLAYVGFVPVAFLYFITRKHVDRNGDAALPSTTISATQ